MKKLFVLFVVVMMAVAGMVVPASAADLPPVPDFGTDADGYTCVSWALVQDSEESYAYHVIYIPDGSDVSVYWNYNSYTNKIVAVGDGDFKSRVIFYDNSSGDWGFTYLPVRANMSVSIAASSFITASDNINDIYNGGFWFAVSDGGSVLTSAVSSDSLVGVLKEVTGLLVIALPVVACLFGIRKGIAWLIGFIRAS